MYDPLIKSQIPVVTRLELLGKDHRARRRKGHEAAAILKGVYRISAGA